MIDKEVIQNQSGYYDGTAGKAILNIEREKKMNNKTGEVWKTQATDGAEYSALTGFVRTLSDAELRDIRIKVADALDLGDAAESVEKKPVENVETRGGDGSASQRLVEVTAQLEVYQKLYNELLVRVV